MCTDLITSLDSHGDCGEPVGLWCEVSAARPTAHPGRAAWWIDATGLSEAARDAQECDRVLWAWVHPTPDTSAWAEVSTSRDTDPGEAGAGGDCGEPSTWGPPYDPGQHPYHVALALVWARVILRDAPEDWRVVRANLKCARWYASRANLAHLRRWGRVSVPRWTPRHPHPLTTV